MGEYKVKKKICCVIMIMIASLCFLSACSFNSPADLVKKFIEKDEPADTRLYDELDLFIARVKKNLNIPDSVNVSYDATLPQYQQNIAKETIYVKFTENGHQVASAECATEDGSLCRSIQMYTPYVSDNTSTTSANSGQTTTNVTNNIVTSTPPTPTTPPASSKTQTSNSPVSYYVYTNSRFGYTINVPDFLVKQPEAQNGSGTNFVSTDGKVTLTVWGSYFPATMSEASTLSGYYQYVGSNLSYTPTYKTKGSNFFVYTGYEGSDIVYQRHILKSDLTENTFVIKYPSSMRDELYDVVTHISKTFKSGVGADSSVSE